MIEHDDLVSTLKRLRRFYPLFDREINAALHSREALDRIRIYSLEAIGDLGDANDLWLVRTELIRVVESVTKALSI
jgi:hypothetical protein